MKRTLTLAMKDFKGIFFGPMFWVIAGMCTAIWTWYYLVYMQKFAQDSMRMMFQMRGQGEGLNIHFGVFVKHISLVNLLLLMGVPALTMRVFAEEKKMKTYDLLLTCPITATQIVIGKYLAVLMAVTVLILISAIYPFSAAFFTNVEWGPLLASFGGILLMTAAYVAMGIFASAVTESIVLAVIIALILNVALWFIGSGVEVVDDPTYSAIFEHLSVGNHLMAFVKGTIKTTGLVFFGSIVFLFCFVTQRVVESARWR